MKTLIILTECALFMVIILGVKSEFVASHQAEERIEMRLNHIDSIIVGKIRNDTIKNAVLINPQTTIPIKIIHK